MNLDWLRKTYFALVFMLMLTISVLCVCRGLRSSLHLQQRMMLLQCLLHYIGLQIDKEYVIESLQEKRISHRDCRQYLWTTLRLYVCFIDNMRWQRDFLCAYLWISLCLFVCFAPSLLLCHCLAHSLSLLFIMSLKLFLFLYVSHNLVVYKWNCFFFLFLFVQKGFWKMIHSFIYVIQIASFFYAWRKENVKLCTFLSVSFSLYHNFPMQSQCFIELHKICTFLLSLFVVV